MWQWRAGASAMMTLLFAPRWITKKIDGVFYELFVALLSMTHWGFIQGALCQNRCLGPCVKVCVHFCVCVRILEQVHAVRAGTTNMPSVCWFLSGSCWNQTGCCVQPVWADEITREPNHKHKPPSTNPELCELWFWSDLIWLDINSVFVSLSNFFQQHLLACNVWTLRLLIRFEAG